MPSQETLSKAKLAYKLISEKIAAGSFAPGHRLVLDQLAKDLNMSTVPIREALRLLEAEGTVEYQRNVGATVAIIDSSEFFTSIQTLSVLEGAATALALGNITPDDIAAARQLNARMRACLVDFTPTLFIQLNQEFHSLLIERCPNNHLLDLARKEWVRVARMSESTLAFVPGRAAKSVEEHEHIVDLIEQKASPQIVEKASRAHWDTTLDAFVVHAGL